MNKKIIMKEIAEQTDEWILNEINSYRLALFNLRVAKSYGKQDALSQFKVIKKNIARLNTELSCRNNKI